MKKTRVLTVGLVLALALAVVSCGKKEPPTLKPMSASEAPTWDGKQPVGDFIVGKWSQGTGMDAETAKEFGLSEEEAVADGKFYWEFKADGTFIYTKTESPDKVHGTWVPAVRGVQLNYERWNDEKLNDFYARMRTEADTGASAAIIREQEVEGTIKMLNSLTYLEIAEDKKGLVFTSATGPSVQGEAGLFNINSDIPLVRMK